MSQTSCTNTEQVKESTHQNRHGTLGKIRDRHATLGKIQDTRSLDEDNAWKLIEDKIRKPEEEPILRSHSVKRDDKKTGRSTAIRRWPHSFRGMDKDWRKLVKVSHADVHGSQADLPEYISPDNVAQSSRRRKVERTKSERAPRRIENYIKGKSSRKDIYLEEDTRNISKDINDSGYRSSIISSDEIEHSSDKSEISSVPGRYSRVSKGLKHYSSEDDETDAKMLFSDAKNNTCLDYGEKEREIRLRKPRGSGLVTSASRVCRNAPIDDIMASSSTCRVKGSTCRYADYTRQKPQRGNHVDDDLYHDLTHIESDSEGASSDGYSSENNDIITSQWRLLGTVHSGRHNSFGQECHQKCLSCLRRESANGSTSRRVSSAHTSPHGGSTTGAMRQPSPVCTSPRQAHHYSGGYYSLQLHDGDDKLKSVCMRVSGELPDDISDERMTTGDLHLIMCGQRCTRHTQGGDTSPCNDHVQQNDTSQNTSALTRSTARSNPRVCYDEHLLSYILSCERDRTSSDDKNISTLHPENSKNPQLRRTRSRRVQDKHNPRIQQRLVQIFVALHD